LSTSSPNSRGFAWALSALVLLGVGFVLAFFWAPIAPGDPASPILFLHVPIALTAYACFAWGAWKALRLLWKHEERYDLESYTAVHMGTIFGILTLVTGSIWARYTWGHWWEWGSRHLVLFLILVLFYSAYFMLRYSVDPGWSRARISAVYALFGVVLMPVSFLAIRLAEEVIHPVVLDEDVGQKLSGSQLITLGVCFAGMLVLAATLYTNELLGKRLDARIHELREALA
jgi:heme exporter protein C